ncbi:MAG: ankyrin repeat domain-containing protein [Candidatus Dependentiae bacterium]|nr:ankyrin repeat domain-containing protein [Candidatus Dependentiae bacterium]
MFKMFKKVILCTFLLGTLQLTAMQENVENTKLLLEDLNNTEPKNIKFLVENGADVNIKNKHGARPLHWACFNNNVEMIKFLVEKGADVNVKNGFGEPPLYWACFNDNVEAVKFLVENGADVNIKDGFGETPLHWACFNNNVEMVKFLVENGADVTVKCEYGKPPLSKTTDQKIRSYLTMLDLIKTFEKELNNFQKTEDGYLSKPTTLTIPRTHYLFDHNKGAYRTAEEKSEVYRKDDFFGNAFLRSVRTGAEMFNQMAIEVADHGKDYKQISPKSLDDIVDLINFFVFAAIKKGEDKFKIRNLALNIKENENNTNMLLGFFKAYGAITTNGLVQKSSHGEWFSIHLAEQEEGYRYLLYGLDAFKSIGLNGLDAYTLQIRPHAKKQGRPATWDNHDNEITLGQEELWEAAKIVLANKPSGAPSSFNPEITGEAKNMSEKSPIGKKTDLFTTENGDEN